MNSRCRKLNTYALLIVSSAILFAGCASRSALVVEFGDEPASQISEAEALAILVCTAVEDFIETNPHIFSKNRKLSDFDNWHDIMAATVPLDLLNQIKMENFVEEPSVPNRFHFGDHWYFIPEKLELQTYRYVQFPISGYNIVFLLDSGGLSVESMSMFHALPAYEELDSKD